MKIAIIGPGVMGRGICRVFAAYSYNVILIGDNKKKLGKALDQIKHQLKQLEDQGKLVDKRGILKRITTSTDLDQIKGATFAIEVINENRKDKLKLIKKIDNILDKRAIIASNTSALSISDLADATEHPDRVIGLHFFNPVGRMQLVEIVKGKKTSSLVVRRCKNLIESLGKASMEAKDTPGFIVNRLLLPVINDAAKMVEKKIASVEDIDRAMKLGASLPLGPFQLADLIGIDVVVDVLKIIAKQTKNSNLYPSNILIKKIKRKELGKKTGKGFYKY